MRAHVIYVLVEELEVLVLREVEEHLLETELKEKVSPGELVRVVLDHGGLREVRHHVPRVLRKDEPTQVVLLALDVLEVSHIDLIVIVELGIVSRRELFTRRTVRHQGFDPRKLF